MIKSQVTFRGVISGPDWRAAEFQSLFGESFMLNEEALRTCIGYLDGMSQDATQERLALEALGRVSDHDQHAATGVAGGPWAVVVGD